MCAFTWPHTNTLYKHKPILSAVKQKAICKYTVEPAPVMASNPVASTIRKGINLEMAQSLIVTFASAFKQKIMNNQARTSLDAIAAF